MGPIRPADRVLLHRVYTRLGVAHFAILEGREVDRTLIAESMALLRVVLDEDAGAVAVQRGDAELACGGGREMVLPLRPWLPWWWPPPRIRRDDVAPRRG